MSELKIGDRVEILSGSHKGELGEVIAIDDNNALDSVVRVNLLYSFNTMWYEEYNLTLVHEPLETYEAKPKPSPSVYIAGPMRGIPEFNFPAFRQAAEVLRALGYFVHSPHEHDEDGGFDVKGMTGNEDLSRVGFNLREALKWDLDRVMEVDLVCLLPGYEKSTGAAAEIALANALGTPVKLLSDIYSPGGFIPMKQEESWTSKPDSESCWDYDMMKSIDQCDNGCCKTPENIVTEIVYTKEDIMQYGAPGSEKASFTWESVAKEVPPILNRLTGETRTTSSTGGQKGMKLARFDLIPSGALHALAEHYGVGAAKYDDNQWRKGYEYSKSYAAMQRHLSAWWGGEDIDEETGSSHLAAAAWHCFALLTFIEDHPSFDDRYKA